jgi:hypothetical protein
MVDYISDDWGYGQMIDTRPQSPGSSTIKNTTTSPSDLDPDLAAMGMIKDLLIKVDTPSDITKPFAVRKALYASLNHNKNIPTGYDATLRIKLYDSYERSSLNIGAKLFNSFMAFLMKPKMIIQGLPTGQTVTNEPGVFGRIVNRLTGKGQPTAPQQVGQQ